MGGMIERLEDLKHQCSWTIIYAEKLIGLIKAEGTGRQRWRKRPKSLIRPVCSSRSDAEVCILK